MRTVEANQASEDLRNRVARLPYTVERQDPMVDGKSNTETVAAFVGLTLAVNVAKNQAEANPDCSYRVWDERSNRVLFTLYAPQPLAA